MLKRIEIFDCDGVLVDSSHRYRNLPNGSIDLEFWRANCTPEKIARDRLLDHARHYKSYLADPTRYVSIMTARQCAAADLQFIRHKLGQPDLLVYRRNGDDRRDWQIKLEAIATLLALPKFRNLPVRLYEDNAITIEQIAARYPLIECVYIPSSQGIKANG